MSRLEEITIQTLNSAMQGQVIALGALVALALIGLGFAIYVLFNKSDSPGKL